MSNIIPQVHLGGTSAEELVRQRCTASAALKAALAAFQEARPHPRDFPSHQHNFDAARAAYADRWLLIDILARELDAEAEDIQRQSDQRRRVRQGAV